MTESSVKFLVGNNAPNAIEASQGKIVANSYGNAALEGFMADPKDPNSKVTLDTTVNPPVLHLRNAITRELIGGYVDNNTGEFLNHNFDSPQSRVSGTYDGQPGTELKLN